MRSSFNPCNFRIALEEEGLNKGWFIALGIPINPVQVAYKGYSVKSPRGSGWISRHGYKTVEVNWPTLQPHQVRIIRKFVEEALDGDGLLYMTVPRSDGSSGSPNDWVDVSGKPDLTDITPMDADTSGIHHENISLFLNDVTLLNVPASV